MNRSGLLAAISLMVAGTGCPFLCVAAGALVSTPKGRRRIEQLRVGDSVFSVDVETGALVEVQVTHIRGATRECLAIELLGGERLTCTPSHPIYDPESGDYRLAADWVTGKATQIARIVEGTLLAQAVELASAYAGIHEVFDISVNGPHHNFIADGVVVHNKTIALDEGADLGEFESETGEDLPPWLRDTAEIPCVEGAVGMCLTVEGREYLLETSSATLDGDLDLVDAQFAPADPDGFPRVSMTFPAGPLGLTCDDADVSILVIFDGHNIVSHPGGLTNPCSIAVYDPPFVDDMIDGSFIAELGQNTTEVYDATASWLDLLIEG